MHAFEPKVIRDRIGEDIVEAVFQQIVKQCQQKGLVKMWKSEGLFAEAKQNHGLSRAKY